MDNSNLLFMDKPSIDYFDITTNKFGWRNHLASDDEVFQRLDQVLATGDFDFYYQGAILLIPDPVPVPRVNWNSTDILCDGQKIFCNGAFIACFHARRVSSGIVVSSLTLREFEHLKSEFEIV